MYIDKEENKQSNKATLSVLYNSQGINSPLLEWVLDNSIIADGSNLCLLVETETILNFQGSSHLIGVGSLSYLFINVQIPAQIVLTRLQLHQIRQFL